MKTFVISTLLFIGLAFFGVEKANAQTQEKQNNTVTNTVQSGFVDANNDGVCDNYDGKRRGQGLAKKDSTNWRQYKGRRNAPRPRYGEGLRYKRDGVAGRRLQDGTGPNCTNPAPEANNP